MTHQQGQLTGMSSATLMPTPPAGAFAVLLQAKTQSIIYTRDGTTPSASNGFVLAVGAVPYSVSGSIAALRFLESVGGAVLNYEFCIDKTAI